MRARTVSQVPPDCGGNLLSPVDRRSRSAASRYERSCGPMREQWALDAVDGIAFRERNAHYGFCAAPSVRQQGCMHVGMLARRIGAHYAERSVRGQFLV